MALVNWTLTPSERQSVRDLEMFEDSASKFVEDFPHYDWIFDMLNVPEDINSIGRVKDVIQTFGKIFPVDFKFFPQGQLADSLNRMDVFDYEVDEDEGIYIKDHLNGQFTLYGATEDKEMLYVDLIAVLKTIGAITEVQHARETKGKPDVLRRKTSMQMAAILLGVDGTEDVFERNWIEASAKKLVSWCNGLWLSLLLGIEPHIIVNGIMEDELDSAEPELMKDEMWANIVEIIINPESANSMFKIAGEYYSPKHAFELDVLQTGIPVNANALMKQIDRASLMLLGKMLEDVKAAEAEELAELEALRPKINQLVDWSLTNKELKAIDKKIGINILPEFLNRNPVYAWMMYRLDMPLEMNTLVRTADVQATLGKIFSIELQCYAPHEFHNAVRKQGLFKDVDISQADCLMYEDEDGRTTIYIACKDKEIRYVELGCLLAAYGHLIEVAHATALNTDDDTLLEKLTSHTMAAMMLGADGSENDTEHGIVAHESRKLSNWLNGIWLCLLLGIDTRTLIASMVLEQEKSPLPHLLTEEHWNVLLDIITNIDAANQLFVEAGNFYNLDGNDTVYEMDVLILDEPFDEIALFKQIDRATCLLLQQIYMQDDQDQDSDGEALTEDLELGSELWPLNELVQSAMKDKGLTAKDVSDKSGVPFRLVFLFLNQLLPIRLFDAMRVCSTLEVDIFDHLEKLNIVRHDLNELSQEGKDASYGYILSGMLGLELDIPMHLLKLNIGRNAHEFVFLLSGKNYRRFKLLMPNAKRNEMISLETMDETVLINMSKINSYSFEEVEYKEMADNFEWPCVNILRDEVESFNVKLDEPSSENGRDGNVGAFLTALMNANEDEFCEFVTDSGEKIKRTRAQISMVAVNHVVTHPHLIQNHTGTAH